MTKNELTEELYVGGALLADGFEDAHIGVAWQVHATIAMDDRARCIRILIERDSMTEEEAEEYFEFNVQGAYMGDATPAFCELLAP